jgi:glutamate 5-kinase
MSAKLKAAQVALRAGIPVIIANGRDKKIISAVLAGRPVGSLFLPKDAGLKGKKVWLSFFPAPAGQIVVDRGASTALARDGKSLLASGILRASGRFGRNSCVAVVTEEGKEIARGISFYSAEEISAIAGCPSSAIRKKLGLPEKDVIQPEVIHRDDLALSP